jgi:phage-related protein
MPTRGIKKLPAIFYKTSNGKEPVRDWLQGLAKPDKQMIGEDIKRVEYGWPIGMPTCKPLGQGIFETRTDLPSERIARVFFCVEEGNVYLLHGIVKKTQKTPLKDIEMARSRRQAVLNWLSEKRVQKSDPAR